MNLDKYFVFDFDSTFTKVEALDVLCDISLQGNPNRESVLHEVQNITNLCMDGKISFRDSLESRLALLHANKSHIPALIEYLKQNVSVSFVRNKAFFTTYSDRVYVISNGFKAFIVPIVEAYGISADHVFANDFIFDEEGNIAGFDKAQCTLRRQWQGAGDQRAGASGRHLCHWRRL